LKKYNSPALRLASFFMSHFVDGRAYQPQAFWRAMQWGSALAVSHFILTAPCGVHPWAAIAFFKAAPAMNFARSSVTMVASPPAITHLPPVGADEADVASASIETAAMPQYAKIFM
jgi:hypothetical protein